MVSKSGFHGVWKMRTRSLQSWYDNGLRTLDTANASNGKSEMTRNNFEEVQYQQTNRGYHDPGVFPVDEKSGEVNSETVNRVEELANKYNFSIATLGWAVLKESKKQPIQPASI
ncbi:hypothetical protein MOSE0_M12354 [Monosporozyma servazzii]